MRVEHRGQSAYPVVADMHATDAQAIDEASTARSAADAPARDEADEAVEEDRRPLGAGTPPAGSAPSADPDAASGDYPDTGSGAAETSIADDRSDSPEGASAPDATTAMSTDAITSAVGGLQVRGANGARCEATDAGLIGSDSSGDTQ